VSADKTIVIGTRGSALALYQSNRVADMIRDALGRECRLEILKTSGDLDTSKPLAELGIVGAFTKELERALLAGEVDVCVHSLKDVPTERPAGLGIAAQPERVMVHDLLIVHPDAVDPTAAPIPLKQGASVGTSSLRRRAQLLALRPDLQIQGIRGNVPTRADKARTGEVDAVVLAAAGVRRLELDLGDLQAFDLSLEQFVPAPGQGALAIETRADDPLFTQLGEALHDADVARCTEAERQTLHGLGAGCSVPLGAQAIPLRTGELLLRAVLGPADPEHPRPRLRQALVRGSDPQALAELTLRILGRPLEASGDALAGKTVLVARDPGRATELIAGIEALGGAARCHAPTAVQPLPADDLEQIVAALQTEGWVLFASANAVQQLLERLGPGAAERLHPPRVGAVGPATARALAEAKVAVDLVADKADAAGLAAAVLARGERPAVFLPAAKGGRPELREALTAAGCRVAVRELYASTPLPPPDTSALADVDAIVFTSPSGARALLEGQPAAREKQLVAIGETTARAIEALGLSCAVASQPSAAALIEALVAVC
jgi:hydroxymethylbilane synthase